MFKFKTANILLICVLFVCIILAVSRHGERNRKFASQHTVQTIDAQEQAYYIWKASNVRGRILVLFDSYPHNMGLISYNGKPQLSRTNLIEFSIFQNIIRKIYFVVPEADWNYFRRQNFIRPIREASDLVKGLYLYNQSGIPIIAVTPSSLPRIEEKTLVYINSRIFDSNEALGLLARNNISSDIAVICEGFK